jgi:hypothetical protein
MRTNVQHHQDGELTQTVRWLSFNESALRATIEELMHSPGVRSVSFQEPRAQLLVRYDAALTSASAIRQGALRAGPERHSESINDAVRWAPTASKYLLMLATALAG